MFNALPPIFNSTSEILILGSFPSVISRVNKFYYANPRNRFWQTLEKIFNEEIEDNNEARTLFLLAHHLALWDIVVSCDIDSSKDETIDNTLIADLYIIINNSHIKKIFCNGKKSYELTMLHYPLLKDIIVYLPSSSPANPRFRFETWKNEFDLVK